MPRVVEILCVAFLIAGLGCAKEDGEPVPSQASIAATIRPDSAGLGDPVELRITSVLPAGSLASFPGDRDSIGAWKVLHADAPVETGGTGEWRRWVRTVTIAGFELGWIGPESLRVLSVEAGGDSSMLSCAAPGLFLGGEIETDAPVDPASARDIRDVVPTGPPRWPWYLCGSILLALAAYLLARVWRRRRDRTEGEAVLAGPTPQEEFEAAIARLLSSGLLEEGRYREFYYGISSAVRLYLERVHELPLLESTSREVSDLLGPKISEAEEKKALNDWLMDGDLVKYARAERLQAEALGYLERSRALVERWTTGARTGDEPTADSGETPPVTEVAR